MSGAAPGLPAPAAPGLQVAIHPQAEGDTIAGHAMQFAQHAQAIPGIREMVQQPHAEYVGDAGIAGLASPANSLRAGVAAGIGQKRPVPQGMSSTESGSPALRKARRASDTSRQELSLRAQLLRYQRA